MDLFSCEPAAGGVGGPADAGRVGGFLAGGLAAGALDSAGPPSVVAGGRATGGRRFAAVGVPAGSTAGRGRGFGFGFDWISPTAGFAAVCREAEGLLPATEAGGSVEGRFTAAGLMTRPEPRRLDPGALTSRPEKSRPGA